MADPPSPVAPSPGEGRRLDLLLQLPQRADARRNYEALLAAAAEVFAAEGPQASLDRIARQAGVGNATLYRHFPDRRDLLVAVCVGEVEALCAQGERLIADEAPEEALMSWLRVYIEHVTAKKGLAVALMTGRSEDSAVITACNTAIGETAAVLLAAAQAVVAIRDDLAVLISLVRGDRVLNVEEVILGRAVDLLDERQAATGVDPTVPDVLRVLEEGPDILRAAARAQTLAGYHSRVHNLVASLLLLCEGTLAGVFDAPTSTPIDLNAPAVSVDISRVGAAGDTLLSAALLCTWAYGHAVVDAAAALADVGIAPRRTHLAVMDELWRALRGAPGLVEYADALTRLNRARGMASLMVTHSLADLDALPTEEDRAKAAGFIDRAAITVLAGLPPRELTRVQEITPLTDAEEMLVSSWSAPDSWRPGARHPGRGKYLIKTGGRLGIPVQMTLLPAEAELYDSDAAIRDVR